LDNALAESFWSTLDRELLDDTVFINRASARLAVFNYMRAGSTLGAVTPRWATTRRLSSSAVGDSTRNLNLRRD
jgi:hypothetical protein